MTVIDYNYLPKNNDAQIEEKGETYNLTKPQIYSFEEKRMCEFTVILNGKTVFKDVVYAKMEKDSVILKNV